MVSRNPIRNFANVHAMAGVREIGIDFIDLPVMSI